MAWPMPSPTTPYRIFLVAPPARVGSALQVAWLRRAPGSRASSPPLAGSWFTLHDSRAPARVSPRNGGRHGTRVELQRRTGRAPPARARARAARAARVPGDGDVDHGAQPP